MSRNVKLNLISVINFNIKTATLLGLTPLLCLLSSPSAYADISSEVIEINRPQQETCEIQAISQDIEQRYSQIKTKLEQDFKEGLPQKLKSDFIQIRKDVDTLSVQSFDLNAQSSQEINLMSQKVIDHLEQMISLLPQASKLAPKVRTQYVVPFTNINSIKADQQECLMRLAIEQVQEAPQETSDESSENIYKKLTTELNELNQNLYRLETTNVQNFISLRAQLLLQLESYNKNPTAQTDLVTQIPQALNSVQAEIEKLLPGLQLSEGYLSAAN